MAEKLVLSSGDDSTTTFRSQPAWAIPWKEASLPLVCYRLEMIGCCSFWAKYTQQSIGHVWLQLICFNLDGSDKLCNTSSSRCSRHLAHWLLLFGQHCFCSAAYLIWRAMPCLCLLILFLITTICSVKHKSIIRKDDSNRVHSNRTYTLQRLMATSVHTTKELTLSAWSSPVEKESRSKQSIEHITINLKANLMNCIQNIIIFLYGTVANKQRTNDQQFNRLVYRYHLFVECEICVWSTVTTFIVERRYHTWSFIKWTIVSDMNMEMEDCYIMSSAS